MDSIVAYTAPGASYPPFVSINLHEGGQVSIAVRAPAKADGSCGDQAEIRIPLSEWKALVYQAYSKNIEL